MPRPRQTLSPKMLAVYMNIIKPRLVVIDGLRTTQDGTSRKTEYGDFRVIEGAN